MTSTTIPTPTADELAAAFVVIPDEDLIHMVRVCDPDTALCGEELPGDEFAEDDEDGQYCPECAAIDRTGDVVHIASCAVCAAEDS
jgi:hypothetical protein